jgi:eukaryotic-like serine/threonine-protein kinase
MPRIDADRNLLFGITALQNDFITRDALIAAMNAWALEKHRPIGDVLVERGALNPGDRDALEAMIARRLAKHGDDPAASLAAMSSIESVAADLRRAVGDPEVLESIAHVSTESLADPHANRAAETVDYVPPHIRYHKVRDHAEGGLGIVFVARDEELNREVALKEIKPRYADNPASQARFLVEAEITGGLEHPGIVPVYGLGHYDDGRPYYAMRFIRGNSLKDAIKAFHADASLKNDPGARTLALQKLLRRFLDVCNAIAYAHNRGVLHRDLKPDNVMVGKYGETLVVDWGLAKTVGRSGDGDGPLPESPIQPASASGSAETIPGTVIGTPGYMSPEQAAGRLDLLGPASDVYGLGATLHALLTGRVPFADKDLAELLRKVERGEFPHPRESTPWLDPALEAVCLKAMALKPEDRYASPRALADDVERWLADEPVTAFREPWTRKARRWARKHRTALVTTATAATVAALLLGGVAWARFAQRQRTDASAQVTLRDAEDRAIKARATGDLADWDKAVAEATQAEVRLESGGGSLALRRDVAARLEGFRAEQARRREVLEGEKKDRQVVDALEAARLQAANLKDGAFDLQAKQDAYMAAFRAYGIDLATLPVEDAARRVRSSKTAADLIAALDDWPSHEGTKDLEERLAAIARSAETDPVRFAIRDAVARRDTAALRGLCESEQARRKLGPRLRQVFDSLLRLDAVGHFPLLEAIVREHPSDFWLNHDLGRAYEAAKPPRLAEAVHYLSVAVALRPDSPGAHVNLGLALGGQGKVELAIAEYRDAIQITPDVAEAHNNLGNALKGQGKVELAIAEFRDAIRIKPDYAEAHTNLGLALADQGKVELAIAEYHDAIRIRPDYAKAHNNLGSALKAQGKVELAIAEYRDAIRINSDLAEAHTNLGSALKGQGKAELAIAEYREAIRINPDLAEAHYNLGVVLADQGKVELAIAEYRDAIRIKPDLAEAHTNFGLALAGQGKVELAIAEFRDAIRVKPDYAEAHYNLGLALKAQGKVELAIAGYRDAIRIKPDLAEAHTNLGNALAGQGKVELAIAEYHDAIRIKPDDAEAHTNLGLALAGQGKVELAIAEYRDAIRINPDYANAHYNLGVALAGQEKVELAIVEYREAIRIKPDLAEAHYTLGVALAGQGKVELAIAEYRDAIRINPDYADAHTNLGNALKAQGKAELAIAEYRDAIRIKPDLAEAHYNLGVALAGQGKAELAIAEYRNAFLIKPDYAEAHYALGNALKALGKVELAIVEYRDALRIKPEFAEAHCNLGLIQQERGDLAEALGHLEKGHELGSRRANWRYPSAQWVSTCRRLVELEAKLPAILKGEVPVRDADERLIVAKFCLAKKLYAGSARFFGEAFADKPALANDLRTGARYNAACSASLAGSGQGKDDPMPDEVGRIKLREQALGWLRADLAIWTKIFDGGNEPARKQAVAMTLAHWKEDADLAGIRDEASLAKLPELEREGFRVLWAEVDRLLAKARAGAP